MVRNGASLASKSGVVNLFGMKLQLDPLVDADLRDSFDIAGTRAEGQAIERMQRTLVFVHGAGCFVFFSAESELGAASPAQQSRAHQPEMQCEQPIAIRVCLIQTNPRENEPQAEEKLRKNRRKNGRESGRVRPLALLRRLFRSVTCGSRPRQTSGTPAGVPSPKAPPRENCTRSPEDGVMRVEIPLMTTPFTQILPLPSHNPISSALFSGTARAVSTRHPPRLTLARLPQTGY